MEVGFLTQVCLLTLCLLLFLVLYWSLFSQWKKMLSVFFEYRRITSFIDIQTYLMEIDDMIPEYIKMFGIL